MKKIGMPRRPGAVPYLKCSPAGGLATARREPTLKPVGRIAALEKPMLRRQRRAKIGTRMSTTSPAASAGTIAPGSVTGLPSTLRVMRASTRALACGPVLESSANGGWLGVAATQRARATLSDVCKSLPNVHATLKACTPRFVRFAWAVARKCHARRSGNVGRMEIAPVVELRVLDERIEAWGLPAYQSAAAAGIDLFACLAEPLVLTAQSPAQLINAGIAIHIADPAITALVVPRSGVGHRRGLVIGNLVGVIDADYTGPLLISAWNRSEPGSAPIVIEPGDRIAQMLFVPVLRPHFAIVTEFSRPTLRGTGGFGSTGHGRAAAEPGR